MPEGSIQSFSSYAETDRSRLSCTPICYHKQKGRDLLQNKGAPTQTFWIRIWSFSLSIAPSTLTAKLLTKKKQVYETRRHFPANVTSLMWIISHCLFLLLKAGSPIPFPRALTRSADLAFALSISLPSPVPHI